MRERGDTKAKYYEVWSDMACSKEKQRLMKSLLVSVCERGGLFRGGLWEYIRSFIYVRDETRAILARPFFSLFRVVDVESDVIGQVGAKFGDG